MRNYENFSCWKSAKCLGLDLHKATVDIDVAEKTELYTSIRRSIRSVMSAIAHGSVQKNEQFAESLLRAIGQTFNCRTQLLLAYELEWFDEVLFNELDERLRSLGFQLYGLKKRLSAESALSRKQY